MGQVQLTIIQAETDKWDSHISSSINSSFSDQYLSYTSPYGIVVTNLSSKEFGGGLISKNYPVPANCKFFGMDVTYYISQEDFLHLARNEMDLKITLQSGSSGPIPNQANGSAQQNFSENGMWQLDPTGQKWVDSGYMPGLPKVGLNTMQFRYWSDGSKWSVTGLRANGGTPFVPNPTLFANLPMITTNWGTGLHPQLQTEVFGAPWALRQTYSRVLILASDSPISWGIAI